MDSKHPNDQADGFYRAWHDTIRIVSPFFVAGVILCDSIATEVAPIVGYMRGWTREKIETYSHRRGWTVERVP